MGGEILRGVDICGSGLTDWVAPDGIARKQED